MKLLPTPATVAEQYLAAIHEVLCDIRTALVDGGPVQPGADVSHLDERFTPSIPSGEPATATPTPTPTKRTRARAAR